MNPNNQTIATAFVNALMARNNCQKSGNKLWLDRWEERIQQLQDELPRGSGFDNGSKFCMLRSNEHCIVIETSYHHMDSNGFYDGWTDHVVRVRPRFDADSFDITVSGRNKRDIKDYIAEGFLHVLRKTAPEVPWANETAQLGSNHA